MSMANGNVNTIMQWQMDNNGNINCNWIESTHFRLKFLTLNSNLLTNS